MMSAEDKLRDYLKRVTTDLRQTRQRLRAAEARSREPIAIVGMACRFPGGVALPEELWQLLADGADAVTGSRPTGAGTSTALYDPDPDGRARSAHPRRRLPRTTLASFDAGVLRHLPARGPRPWTRSSGCCWRPSWEAFERAGIDPQSLRGSRTGVFVGRQRPGLRARCCARAPRGRRGLRSAPAPRRASLSGRVSYTLGLEGPAVTVDTACSSSLVALHLAAPGAARRGVRPGPGRRGDGDVDPGRVRRVHPAARAGPRRAVQGVRRRRRRHRLGRGRRGAGARAAVRRPPQRPPGARGGPGLARSTRTARPTG